MYLAWREMRFAKMRYALILTLLILVAFLVLFVTGLAKGLSYANASSIKNMDADYFVVQKQADHRFARSSLTDKDLEAARAVVGEDKAVSLGLRMTSVTEQGGTKQSDVTLFAVDPTGWLAPTVKEGKSLGSTEKGQVLADRQLQDDGVQIGTVLTDRASGLSWKVSGFVEGASYSHTPGLFLSAADWKELRETTSGRGNSAEAAPYAAIAIHTDSAGAEKLRAALPDSEVITKADAVSAIPGYKEEQGSLLMMIVFLFIMSTLVLGIFFYVMTIQKTSQFGVLKAIGTKTRYLAATVIGQVVLLTVVGLAISLTAIAIVKAVLPATMPFELDSSTLILTCSLFIGTTLIGSLLSLWRVARTDALDAIGRSYV